MLLYQKINGEYKLVQSTSISYQNYLLCEIYTFRNPTLRPGFQPCQGGIVEQAATLYPEAWAYLQTTEGQQLCTTEAEWQAMTQATWGNGLFKASWNGIGGAPYFVQDLEAGTLRMPDLRGMFECATDTTLGVGEARGDTVRPASAYTYGFCTYSPGTDTTKVFGAIKERKGAYTEGTSGFYYSLYFNIENGLPSGDVISPKAYGMLTCAYLGQPAA